MQKIVEGNWKKNPDNDFMIQSCHILEKSWIIFLVLESPWILFIGPGKYFEDFFMLYRDRIVQSCFFCLQ